MLKKSFQQLGFTLIELMVVVAIIGLLAAAGLVAFTGAQKSSREATRKADVNAISKALEQYYVNGYVYPVASGYSSLSTAISSYFPGNALPADPRNVSPYQYSAVSSATGYCVCAALENLGKGNATAQATSVNCAFGPVASGVQGYQCQSNLQ